MRIWLDVQDASGNVLGDGPVRNVVSARVVRKLDGVGSVSVTLPGTDARSLDLLTNERRVSVKALPPSGVVREIGFGIVKRREFSEDAGGWQFTIDGPDRLHELKLKNTLLAREYKDVAISTVVNELCALAGWTATVDGGLDNLYARFDAISVLKALQSIAEKHGLHFRHLSGQQIEFGALGASSGLRVIHKDQAPAELYNNDEVALIERLSVSYESEDLANWLVPIGAGEGESALTLAQSTRTTPYTIQTTTGPDGKTLYYLADSTSIATYGQIEKIGTFKDIAPLSNSDEDILNAANALYDAAAAWLARHKEEQVIYSLAVKKAWAANILPGDKIQITYSGYVFDDQGNRVDYVNVDDEFWVVEAQENIGHTQAVSLKVAKVDRLELDTAGIVIGRLESIELRNIKVQTYPTLANYTYVRLMDDDHVAEVPVLITDAVTYLHRARLRIATRPMRATAKSTLGESKEKLSVYQESAPAGTTDIWVYTAWAPDYDTNDVELVKTKVTVDSSADYSGRNWYTYLHTTAFQLQYGVFDDTVYPGGIGIKINNEDRTGALGGPWGTTTSAANVDIDITDYLNNATGGLRQEHTVEFYCASGQGEVEVVVELFQTVQSIAVT